jgi:hypothetical protein
MKSTAKSPCSSGVSDAVAWLLVIRSSTMWPENTNLWKWCKLCPNIVDHASASVDEVKLCYRGNVDVQPMSIDGRSTMCGHTFTFWETWRDSSERGLYHFHLDFQAPLRYSALLKDAGIRFQNAAGRPYSLAVVLTLRTSFKG